MIDRLNRWEENNFHEGDIVKKGKMKQRRRKSIKEKAHRIKSIGAMINLE